MLKVIEATRSTMEGRMLSSTDSVEKVHLRAKAELFQDMVKEATESQARLGVELEMKTSVHAQLQSRSLGLKRQHAALEKHIRQINEGFNGAGVFPHPMVYGDDAFGVTDMTITFGACILCSQPFPYYDLVVCSCRHVYHPWCASIWFKENA